MDEMDTFKCCFMLEKKGENGSMDLKQAYGQEFERAKQRQITKLNKLIEARWCLKRNL